MKNSINNKYMLKKNLLWQKITLMLFGLFLTIIILEIGLRIGGFAILSMQEYRNQQSIKQKGLFHIMCLGESTTQGTYPPYLEEILNQRNIGIKFSVIDKGLSGTNTGVILSDLEANLNKYWPDMVITMMGINDGGSHMPYETASTSKIVLTLRSFKVYKLARLLWLHIVTKLKETGLLYAQDVDKQKDKPKEAYKEVYKELQHPNPKNDTASMQLSWLYRSQGKYTESEQALKKAIELNPKNDSAYIELGRLYQSHGKLAESEQAFKKVMELNPKNDAAYIGLGIFYHSQGKYAESEEAFKKAIELNPHNERLYGCLATIYSEIGNNELSEVYAKKADSLRAEGFNPNTINNYRTLKQILDKRKIRLVCVQYPVRNIAPLKKIFKEEPEAGIVFVDNERIFKDAIGKEGYGEYFVDMFGGDFGHCTQKGNRLLAENIANAILKEYFNK